ncbi:hypothetical protein R1flu_027038 [Riccia fluitans]|uniref:Plant heme peroxidase family profile domain-containing protein n=1 Tax=Riccia fluitans TaxID=41844 RepID=A0ABD1XHM6_9MARC
MDQSTTTDKWDRDYYSNILGGKVLFESDNALRTNSQGSKIVTSLSKPSSTFNTEFSAAMVKMSKLNVLTGSSGQIRTKCNMVN